MPKGQKRPERQNMHPAESDTLQLSLAGRSSERPAFFPDVLLYRGRGGDGEECLITFDRETVVLSRRVGGLACRIRLSVGHYQAVGLVAGEENHVVRLMHGDDGLSVDLTEINNLEEAEEYRDRLASFLGLPSVTMAGARPISCPHAAVLTGGRTRLMKRRRARFLTRRKPGEVVDIRRLEGRELIARG